jgi:hypothetical protein
MALNLHISSYEFTEGNSANTSGVAPSMQVTSARRFNSKTSSIQYWVLNIDLRKHLLTNSPTMRVFVYFHWTYTTNDFLFLKKDLFPSKYVELFLIVVPCILISSNSLIPQQMHYLLILENSKIYIKT